MAEPPPRALGWRRSWSGRLAARLAALWLVLACVVGPAGASWAGVSAEPAAEPVAAAAGLLAMQAADRAAEHAWLVERQGRLARQHEAAATKRQASEWQLRRLAAEFGTVALAMAELAAERERRSVELGQRQQRLEGLLAEIVQLSRDEAGDQRRLAQLRAVAASMAQPFQAARTALVETRAAAAALGERQAGLAEASHAARAAMRDAGAAGERLARAAAANRLQATEALDRAQAAARATVLAERRLARVLASRDVPAAGVASPRLAPRTPAPVSTVRLAPRVLTARAVVMERPVRALAHYDVPGMMAGARLLADGSGARDGGHVTPVAGAVVSRFGEGQQAPFDRGLTIEVEDRRLVRAPREGRVVFARRYEGFGLLLIIDHGNEYHSLLSGLSRFVVHEGWTVRAGQMVGTLEPESRTPGRLYVELRRRGVPVDPLTWFAAGQDKVRS